MHNVYTCSISRLTKNDIAHHLSQIPGYCSVQIIPETVVNTGTVSSVP